MKNIAVVLIILGIVVALFSTLLVFNPLKKQIKNSKFEKYNKLYGDTEYDDYREDEDFNILINMTKRIIYIMCLIFVLLGLVMYFIFK